MSEPTKVWLKGLISAAASGSTTGFGLLAIKPELDAIVFFEMGGIGAIVGVVNYLVRSPLP